MNGILRSVYQVSLVDEPSVSPRVAAAAAAPPTRATVPSAVPDRPRQPITVATLREAKAARERPGPATVPPRVPITQRIKEPEVPARLRTKRKTIAFGVTTNVSQTVEREKDPDQQQQHSPPMLARVGVAMERTGTARGTARGKEERGEENRDPRGERKEEEGVEVGGELELLRESHTRLSARVAELEKKEEESRKRETELSRQFDRLVKIVGTCTQRIEELGGGGESTVGGARSTVERRGGGRREKSVEEKPRGKQWSDEEERDCSRRGGRREEESGRRRLEAGGGILSDQDVIRALDRQLAANPILRRAVQDAIDQDNYEHEYGEKRKEPARRHLLDEFKDPRAAAGRSAPRKEETMVRRTERFRTTPPEGGRRKRADGTPSRRRVTERVMMERVHHFDDEDEEDEESEGGARRVYETEYETRYDSDDRQYRTEYNEEIIDDFQSVAQTEFRRGYGNERRRAADQTFGGGGGRGVMITEVSDSEDRLEQRRREIRERRKAKEARK